MFELSASPLDTARLTAALTNPQAGALATFQGWVRNHHRGRTVVRLQYEAYKELAGSEGQQIILEARTKFDVIDAGCAHRVGVLEVGDIAVWVGVTAGHRDAAFRACQYIIDETKKRVPVWKKEFYEDGESGWVHLEDHTAPTRVQVS